MDSSSLGHAGDFGSLAHYADSAYYDLTYRERKHDVDYYVALARRTPDLRVLEYGCGSGRVTIPMANARCSVTAVDLSMPMLNALQRKLAELPDQVRARVCVHRDDMRSFSIEERFSLVIAPFNTVLHLYEPEEMSAFLERVRAHLAPNGRFVFDVSVPKAADLDHDPSESLEADPFVCPTTGKRVRYSEQFEYDPIRQLLVVWMNFEPEDGSPSWTVPLTHRQYFPQELKAILLSAGFRDIEFFSDFSEEPPGSYTDSLVISCR
ncbi:MAG: class I SAM-dependent methyltransferase [Polyangiaceae bacterium]